MSALPNAVSTIVGQTVTFNLTGLTDPSGVGLAAASKIATELAGAPPASKK